MLQCSKCEKIKPTSSFNRDRGKPTGFYSSCKDCARATNKISKAKNMPDVLSYNAKWNKANPDKVAVYRRKWLVRLYGITWDQYQGIIAYQGGKCAICFTDKPGKRLRSWMIDHDHSTGEVRGVLCENCNRALGMMQDDPDRLRMAADYLERTVRRRAA